MTENYNLNKFPVRKANKSRTSKTNKYSLSIGDAVFDRSR